MPTKKIIFFISILMLVCPTVSLQAAELFQPSSVQDLWYAFTEYDGLDTEIVCSHWNGAKWSKPVQLTNNTRNDFTPAVALDKDKNPWVVWIGNDGISTSVYSKYWDGGEWSETTQVDDVDIYFDSTPAITFDKNNVPWVVWTGSNGTSDDIYVSRWKKGQWSIPVMINNNNSVPDIMPAISNDNENNLIIVWCSYSINHYALLFSKKLDNTWSRPEAVVSDNERFSADLPGILKKSNKKLELLWYENNNCYKSIWDGSIWTEPKQTEILLPGNFLATTSLGPAYISWTQNNVYQSLRILPPKPQNTLHTYISNSFTKFLAWSKSIFCNDAYAGELDNKQALLSAEETTYIAFGDSITVGVGATETSPGVYYGYPPRLEGRLDDDIGSSIVVNNGVSGERTIQGLDRINSVIAQNNGKYILIMEGTNDMTWQYSTETIIYNLEQMIDRAQIAGVRPLLATLPPRLDHLNDRVVNDVNPAIINLAQEKGVTSVDQYSKIAGNKNAYMSDAKHPNDGGYQLMSDSWYETISSIVDGGGGDSGGGGGCGTISPIYRNGDNNGLGGNLIMLTLILLFIMTFKKLRFCN